MYIFIYLSSKSNTIYLSISLIFKKCDNANCQNYCEIHYGNTFYRLCRSCGKTSRADYNHLALEKIKLRLIFSGKLRKKNYVLLFNLV